MYYATLYQLWRLELLRLHVLNRFGNLLCFSLKQYTLAAYSDIVMTLLLWQVFTLSKTRVRRGKKRNTLLSNFFLIGGWRWWWKFWNHKRDAQGEFMNQYQDWYIDTSCLRWWPQRWSSDRCWQWSSSKFFSWYLPLHFLPLLYIRYFRWTTFKWGCAEDSVLCFWRKLGSLGFGR